MNLTTSALLLNTIMAAFKPVYIASRALQFIELISSCDEEGFPQYLLFRTLGLCLALADPPTDQRLQVLNDVWRVVTKLYDPAHYISCAEVWVQFAVRHFSVSTGRHAFRASEKLGETGKHEVICRAKESESEVILGRIGVFKNPREVNTFLGDIIHHMTPDRAYENHYPQLHAVIDKVLTHSKDFESLFTMDKFLPLLDMFQKESIKVEVCKSIMDTFARSQQDQTNDPVITNALMFICRVMHDSVNALSVEDERRQIGNLISTFVRKVDYGRDFEQQLSFYVEARSSFTNLDSVHAQLVQNVNRLSVETRRIVKGHHTRKTAAFVRACAAYSDACFKAALSLIPELPKTVECDGKPRSSESYLVSYLCHFLSTLLVVPDSPEQGVLYLTRGLLNVLQHYTWEPTSNAKPVVYLHVLDMLSTAAQETYPYHIEKGLFAPNDTRS
uniref:VPS35 endosomal protein-sorting factor-like n=1 Tax=Timema poppense TaxID=170557 RepID=A0A7R9DLX2_TIMPO|nr:unnamed protein product [Timema poppensis]